MSADNDHITGLALRVLEDVLARAEYAPVQPDWGTALALSWLKQIGLLEQWNCECFWRNMADAHERQPGVMPSYIRTSSLTGTLRRCYLRLGWEEPCLIKRAKWSEKYKPELS